MSSREKIGFIGAGKMAQALIAAVLRGDIAQKNTIIASDPLETQCRKVHQEFGIHTTDDNREVISNSDIVVLAFKPQNFPNAIEGLAEAVGKSQIIISIMAGIRIERIQQYLPGRVVRVMPNTACLVGEMAAGFAVADNLTEDDINTVSGILGAAGIALQVTESQLDAVTALSGSGPAFAARIIEYFITAGAAAGLPEQIATELTLKTFAGTVRLLTELAMEPEELIKMVSSPNGTTVAGREVLENSDVASAIKATVARAAQRSKELGK